MLVGSAAALILARLIIRGETTCQCERCLPPGGMCGWVQSSPLFQRDSSIALASLLVSVVESFGPTGIGSDSMPSSPRASVVIPAFRARDQIGVALNSLAGQSWTGLLETIVVASGDDECAEWIAKHYPAVRVISSPKRLWPGEARNVGVRASQGDVIAFMPADGEVTTEWLEQRMSGHERGADLVGGSVLNGRPCHPVSTAEYLLEYSALMPIRSLLEEQQIPHAVSFKRAVFDLIGCYSEDTQTGEDTLFNQKCVEEGLAVVYLPTAGLIHKGNRSIGKMCRHAYEHGRGLVQCVDAHGLKASVGPMSQPAVTAAWRMLLLYPILGFKAKALRLARFAPLQLVTLMVLAPIVFLGLLATGWGAWMEYLRIRDKTGEGSPLSRSS